jgi:hypothetical protein
MLFYLQGLDQCRDAKIRRTIFSKAFTNKKGKIKFEEFQAKNIRNFRHSITEEKQLGNTFRDCDHFTNNQRFYAKSVQIFYDLKIGITCSKC